MPHSQPDIYKYYDYQKYLRDYYEWKKEKHAYFSFRYISNKVGLNHGFLIKIFQGQRNLSTEKIADFVKLLGLSQRKSGYFETLVYYGRAKTDREIKQYFEQLLKYTDLGTQKVAKEKYEFYQKWYYSAIREVIHFVPFKNNYKLLAETLEPSITGTEAKQAVTLLKRLNLIKKSREGTYKLTSKFITTDEKWMGTSVKTFQKETIDLAKQALDTIPKEQRNISTVSLSMDKEAIAKIKERIAQFHQDLLEIADSSAEVDRAYQINIQVFPLSKPYIGEQHDA